jgi:molybdopterin-guanine dinucleotide biosynthesis protein A/nucleoside-triphosphatase THEP1
MNQVFILTGDIRTGKTTWLRHWISQLKLQGQEIHGFVSLDAKTGSMSSIEKSNSLRKLLNLNTLEIIEFEVAVNVDVDEADDCIRVGKFIFKKSAFSEGLLWLKKSIESPSTDWIIIDEVGKLELHKNEGFNPELDQFFKDCQAKSSGEFHANVLVVVRTELLSMFTEKYKQLFPNLQILHLQNQITKDFFRVSLDNKSIDCKIEGLVLGGGESSRMGYPKYKLEYVPGCPQWVRLLKAIHPLSQQLALSIPRKEEKAMEVELANLEIDFDRIKLQCDASEFENSGPIGGVLSYWKDNFSLSSEGLLVVAVDYPYLRDEALNELVYAFYKTGKSVFYFDDSTGIINGLIGIYSRSDLELLEQWYADGNESISRFLRKNRQNLTLLTPQNWSELISVDEGRFNEKWVPLN